MLRLVVRAADASLPPRGSMPARPDARPAASSLEGIHANSRRVYRSCRCCRRTKPSRFCAVARCICRQGPADARATRRTGPAGPWHDHGRESAGATQGAQIPPLFVIESELRLAMVKAELEFV